ncbi:MAG: hypothetical protein ACK4Z0_04130 [Sphingomonadaceae bacterium]
MTAVATFRDKYFALPGDMRNATSFWSDQASGTDGCPDPAIPDGTPGTCNGDGNGNIGVNSPANPEGLRAWQHLQLAGLIEGTYTGITMGAPNPAVPGTNVPRSKLGQAGWGLFYRSPTAPIWQQSSNFLQIGTIDGNGLFRGAMNPSEAWNIDTKVDDGSPVSGALLGAPASTQLCINPPAPTGPSFDPPANRVYDLTQTATNLCALYFKLNM